MSASLERYQRRKHKYIIYGYARIKMKTIMIDDICFLCAKFLGLLDGKIDIDPKYRITSIMNILLENTIPSNAKPLEHIFDGIQTKYPIGYTNWQTFYDLAYNSTPFYIGPWYNIATIKDEKLLRALSVCINWSWSMFNYNNRYELLKKYLDVIINLSKKGIDIKYQYMSQLITMYEYYYFDIYVLKYIKQKSGTINSTKLNNTLKPVIIEQLNESSSDKQYDIEFNINLDEWSNSNAMKMNSLLQTMVIEYKHDIDDALMELDNILDVVKVKYKMIKIQLQQVLEQKITEYFNNTLYKKISRVGTKMGDIAVKGAMMTVAVPVIAGAMVIIIGACGVASVYKIVARDVRPVDAIMLSVIN